MEAHKVNSEEHEKKVSAKVLDYLQSGKCGDVVLVSKRDGRRMRAHRMVLSACSEYFEAILMNKAARIEELELEVDGKILGALMLYCYFGEICELEKIAEDLIVAAAQYQMQPLVDVCAHYLVDLKTSNCLKIVLLAERHNLSDLLKKAKGLVCQHFMEISKTEEFLQLTLENVRNIIASDDLQVPSEEDVLNSVLLWLLYDWPNRQAHFPTLMEWIRLSLLSSTFLKDRIWGSDRECRELMKLMEHHLEMEGTTSQVGLSKTPRKGSSAILMLEQNCTNPKKLFYVLRSFCPQSGIKKEWSNLPHEDGKFYVALLGRNLIIAGGYLSPTFETVNIAYVQNLETKEWTALSPMQMSRKFFRLVALNGFVYVIGGLDNNNHRLNTVERLDPRDLKNTWEYVAPMSCSRDGLAAAVLEGRLYVAGGCETKTVECYDPKTNMWTERAPMNDVRLGCKAVAGYGYLYVFGGRKYSKNVRTFERYDPQVNKWTQLCSLIDGQEHFAAAIIGNRILALSIGLDYSKSSLKEYNIATDKWKLLGSCGAIDQIITVPNFYSLNST